MKHLPLVLLCVIIVSCSSVEIHFNGSPGITRPCRVCIGHFEKRTFDFNPFVVSNFRDALRYEFFRRGYAVSQLPADAAGERGNAPWDLGAPAITEACSGNSADIFIQGSVFEAQIGDGIENETTTAVNIGLYNKSGKKIGEARAITSDTLTDVRTVRAISASIVDNIHDELGR
jgi:hypothetical protein